MSVNKDGISAYVQASVANRESQSVNPQQRVNTYGSINDTEDQVDDKDQIIVFDQNGESTTFDDEILRNADPGTKALFSEKIKSAMMFIISAPKGAAQLYATFGPVAMIYQKNGMWLAAPVATGAAISFTHASFNILQKHCLPENKFIQFCSKRLFFLDEGVGGFMADFGFAWSMMRNLGSTFGPLFGASTNAIKNYTLFATPFLAFPTALVDRTVRYQDKQGKFYQRGFFRHLSRTLRGATSTLGLINQLVLQGVIATDSYIPTACILFTAIAGGASSLLEESHGKVSMALMAMINLLCENPSLACALFSFPNDIYAALNDNTISNEFFYSMLAVSICFWAGLEGLSLMAMATKAKEAKAEAEQTDAFSRDEETQSSDCEMSDEINIDNDTTVYQGEEFFDCDDGQDDMSPTTRWCNIL